MYGSDLINKPRSTIWKGEKWSNRREYSFAPWEIEANERADQLYEGFLRREVIQAMGENANAYTTAHALRFAFPLDDVFRHTQELHRERERREEREGRD